MSTLLLQLYSQNHWTADGSQTIWNFTFADGYLSRDFVEAYYFDLLENKTQVTITNDMFVGDFQLNFTPAIPAGYRFVILRNTPKDAPLVNFGDGARMSEVSLDTVARQAVHIAAEVLDGSGLGLLSEELGFKAMKQVPYVGASVAVVADNGKCHYKEDATSVTVPNTLPVTYLTSIVNDSTANMTIVFDSAVGIMQGSTNITGKSSWVLAPRNILSITKVKNGRWFISGSAS